MPHHLYETLFNDDEDDHDNSNDISMEIINQLHGHMDFQLVSKYYDLLTYNRLFYTAQSQNINIIHLNSRSLPKNFDNIQSFIKSLHTQPDISTITETWLTDNDKHLYQLTGY